MRRSPLRAYNVIENRVSVIHQGHVYMYCFHDGDEREIVRVIEGDVAVGKLHPFAGGMLRFIIEVGEGKAFD